MTNDFYSVAIGIQNKGGEIVGVVLNVQTGYSLILAGHALSAAAWKASTAFISSSAR